MTETQNTDQVAKAFQAHLDSAVRGAETSAKEFAQAIEQYGVTYAAEWAAHSAVLRREIAELWKRADHLRTENGLPPETAVIAVRENVAKKLLRNDVHSSSTSQFTNATRAATAEAYARFVEDADDFVAYYS